MMMADIPRLRMVQMMSRLRMDSKTSLRKMSLLKMNPKNHLWAALSADPDLSSVACLRVQRHLGHGSLLRRPSW
jgi:hypothetical protein